MSNYISNKKFDEHLEELARKIEKEAVSVEDAARIVKEFKIYRQNKE